MGELATRNLFDLLPEHIADLILSKASLINKNAIHLSLVSKQFFSLLRNRSTLTLVSEVSPSRYEGSLYEELFRIHCEEYQKEVREVRYMCSTLKRYHKENIHLDTLKFHLRGKLSDADARDLDECIELAAKKRLTSLDLNHHYCYELPEAFFRVESLVELRLEGCSLRAESLIVRLPNLRKLYLNFISMSNEGVLENIIKGCPSTETLSIGCCDLDNPGFNFKVSNLPNLKTLDIKCLGDPDEIAIEVRASAATRVEHVKCRQPVDLGEHEYPNLKILDLHKAKIVNANFFTNFGCKFPRLEYLSLGHTLGTDRVSLWSPTLKEICLFGKYEPLEEACFDVPNILSFKYSQKHLSGVPKLSFTSGECIAQIELEGCEDDIQGSWFSEQKQFFSQLNMPFEASIDVIFPENVFSNEAHWLTARSDLSFPPSGIITGIQEFTIILSDWKQFSLSFVRLIMDAILLNYRPQTIKICYNWIYCIENGIEQNVKYMWDATNSPISKSADIIELLKPHEDEKGFGAIFNLS